jgi:hypothetical protein
MMHWVTDAADQELCFSAFVLDAAIALDDCRHSRNMRLRHPETNERKAAIFVEMQRAVCNNRHPPGRRRTEDSNAPLIGISLTCCARFLSAQHNGR